MVVDVRLQGFSRRDFLKAGGDETSTELACSSKSGSSDSNGESDGGDDGGGGGGDGESSGGDDDEDDPSRLAANCGGQVPILPVGSLGSSSSPISFLAEVLTIIVCLIVIWEFIVKRFFGF